MAILTKEAILNSSDLKRETVDVPEWGGEVLVRELTSAERDQFEIFILERKKQDDYRGVRAKLLSLTVVNEAGERLFSDDDIEALAQKSASAVDRIFSVAQRLSGFGIDKFKEIEQDFARDQSDVSTSG